MSKKCLYCGKDLSGRKQKYCDDLCQYRYLSIKNDKHKKRSISQDLRMLRAGRKQRSGKIGVRYN